MTTRRDMRRRTLMLLFLPMQALLVPVVEAFGALSIPLLTVESAALVGTVAVFGLACGAVLAWLAPAEPGNGVRDLLFAVALAMVCLAVLDVSAGGHRVFAAFASGRLARFAMLLGIAGSLVFVLWRMRRHIVPILFVAASAFFLSTMALNASILGVPAPASTVDHDAKALGDWPPFLYVVLDEAMGIDGLTGAPGGAPLAKSLMATFENHGFRVYGRAFSRHFVSARSIPNALNFDFRDGSWGPLLRHHKDLAVNSRLFDGLVGRGYELVSYDTAHINFCFAGASRCEGLPSFNPFNPYLRSGRPRHAALFQVMRNTFSESYLAYNAMSLLSRVVQDGPPPPFVGFDGIAFPAWFDRFQTDVTHSPRGRAYFAHLLMPHAPYVLDESCLETGRATVGYFLAEERGLSGERLETERAARYGDYIRQYRCVASRLDDLLGALDRLPQFRDATIVIHGDHGPRISAGQYAGSLSSRDMVDNYSSLYAIRSPGVAPGYDSRKTSIQRLTAEYFSGQPTEALGPDEQSVAVDVDANGRVVTLPMPDSVTTIGE